MMRNQIGQCTAQIWRLGQIGCNRLFGVDRCRSRSISRPRIGGTLLVLTLADPLGDVRPPIIVTWVIEASPNLRVRVIEQ
jgi:hypothetical protein